MEISKVLTVCGLLVSALSLADPVTAAGTLTIDETKWVSVGAGMRTSFNSVEDGAPSGEDRSADFELDNLRLYVNGQAHEYVYMTFNTERDADDEIRVLDAIARFELSDVFNVWIGRMLPPSDRSNLDGPYYLNIWDFPEVQAYPTIFAGRDDGVAYWGQLGGGKLKWQLGAFEGPTTQDDDVLFAARATYNYWDPEPGYYTSSTYYGDKEILALGGAVQTQDGNTAWNIDGLMETKLGGGVVSLEGAYYDYDELGGLGTPAPDATGTKSDGWFVLGGYLFPQRVGIGRFQVLARYTDGSVDNGPDGDIVDVNLNYIIAGHDARVSLVYQKPDGDLFGDNDVIRLGVQVQI